MFAERKEETVKKKNDLADPENSIYMLRYFPWCSVQHAALTKTICMLSARWYPMQFTRFFLSLHLILLLHLMNLLFPFSTRGREGGSIASSIYCRYPRAILYTNLEAKSGKEMTVSDAWYINIAIPFFVVSAYLLYQKMIRSVRLIRFQIELRRWIEASRYEYREWQRW